MRACVLVFLAAALWVATSPGSDGLSHRSDSERSDPLVDRSCKPIAPITVELRPADQQGSRVDLELSVRAERPMLSLSWELELPSDAVVTAGERNGVAAPERGVVTTDRVQLDMPIDDSYRHVRVVATGVFLGSDETGATFEETVVGTAGLAWGEPTISAPTAWTPDAETGELVEVVVLPTVHRAGR